MTVDEIINYKTTNQIKIYKLNQLGLSNVMIIDAMKQSFNSLQSNDNKKKYYVNSILKEFMKNPEKIQKANKIQD